MKKGVIVLAFIGLFVFSASSVFAHLEWTDWGTDQNCPTDHIGVRYECRNGNGFDAEECRMQCRSLPSGSTWGTGTTFRNGFFVYKGQPSTWAQGVCPAGYAVYGFLCSASEGCDEPNWENFRCIEIDNANVASITSENDWVGSSDGDENCGIEYFVGFGCSGPCGGSGGSGHDFACATITATCSDNDGDGYGPGCSLGTDCDDNNASINPAATEVCDGVDNDCNLEVDSIGGVGLCGAGAQCEEDSYCASPLICAGAPAGTCVNPSVNTAQWEGITGGVISNADLDDVVTLRAFGNDLTGGGEELKFDIIKDGFWIFDRLIDSQLSTEGFINWVANESGTYTFNVTATATGSHAESGNLIVSSTPDNDLPSVVIDAPALGAIHYTGVPVQFSATGSDNDNLLSYRWDFDEPLPSPVSSEFFEEDPLYTFTTPGMKKISVKAIEVSTQNDYVYENHEGFVHETQVAGTIPLHRWWNGVIQDHYYFSEDSSYTIGETLGSDPNYVYEGVEGYVYENQSFGTVALHRWWEPVVADHFYFVSNNTYTIGEILNPSSGFNWSYEGVEGYVYEDQVDGTTELHRWWNPILGDHFYDANKREIATTELSVLILSSPGIFTYISEPSFGEIIVSETLEVTYNGSDSYVVDSVSVGSPCTTTVECLAGNCPTQTGGSPSCASNTSEQITIQNTHGGMGNLAPLNYKWLFKIGGQDVNVEGSGDIESSGTHHYAEGGDKNLTVVVNYSNSLLGIDVEESFERHFEILDVRQCKDNGQTWVDISTGEEFDTLSTGACDGEDDIIGNADDCCPTGHACTATGCVLDDRTPLSCEGYNVFSNYSDLIADPLINSNETACNADPFNAVESDALYGLTDCGGLDEFGRTVQCQCLWFNESCEFNATYLDNPGPPNVEDVSCTYDSSLSACLDNFQTITVTLLDGDPIECTDAGTQVVPCGKPSVSLPFFGLVNFVIAILIVVLIYYLFFRNKGKKNTRKIKKSRKNRKR